MPKPDIYIVVFIPHNIPTMEVLWSPVLKKIFKRLEGKENSGKSNSKGGWIRGLRKPNTKKKGRERG